MLGHKTFVFLILIVETVFVNSEHKSLWNQLFPDDVQWSPYRVKGHKIDYSSIQDSNDINSYRVCETPECKKVADEFTSSMDKTIKPCDDFYAFSCGAWNAADSIPPDYPAWSRFQIFQNTVAHRIKGILESEPTSSDILPLRQAKKWYHSCMDTETLNRRGVKPIESVLLRAGGWPISMDADEWHADDHNWQNVDRNYIHLTGSSTFFDIEVRPPSEEDDEFGTILIKSQKPPLHELIPVKYRNYEGNDYEEYVKIVTVVAQIFAARNRADVTEKKVIEEARQIVEFEKEIYTLVKDDSKRKQMVLEEFYSWYALNVTKENKISKDLIDWRSLISGLFGSVNIKPDPFTDVVLNDLRFIKNIGHLLDKTPKRTVVNYIHWNFIANMLMYTTESMRDNVFELIGPEYGIKQRRPRWDECVTDMKMSHAAAYEFVQRYFPKNTEDATFKMIKNIEAEMEKKIDNSNWLDEESKRLAKYKLKKMKLFVGFPDWYKDKKAVINHYKGLNIGSEYFDNALSYVRYERKDNLKSYLRRSADDSWKIDPITVNALYNPLENAINIPAVDMQSPLFTPNLPDSVNYGIAGVVVGHEIGHGFDDTGIMFSGNGSMSEMSRTMLMGFYERARCFIEQFGEYYGETEAPETTESPEIESNEDGPELFTLGENMADSTGLQSVFQAYHNLKKSEGDMRLPGFEEFTDDQMFFISFAAMWCKVETPEFTKNKEKENDPHSPSKLRVIGAVSNTHAFAKAFNCPVGSAMNPTDKCDVWRKSGGTADDKSAAAIRKNNHHKWWDGQWKN